MLFVFQNKDKDLHGIYQYWSFQNVFALDLGHFQHSNSK